MTDADGADWPPDRTEAKTPLALFGAQLDVTDRTARPRDPGVVEVHEAEEWSAVYLDGKLVRQGDSYLADDWVREHFGVVTVQDDAFLRGGTGSETAQTLDEVADYAAERATRAERAADLERRASEMFDEARRLRQQR